MKLYLRRQIVITGILYIGQMLVGYSLGWTAPIIPKLQNEDDSPLSGAISGTTASWIGSVFYIGGITGPHVTAYLSNIIGRKPCLIIGGAITTLSFIIVILTRNLAMIFATRVLMGLGAGIINIGSVVYIGEIASTKIRGILLTITGISATLGTLVIYSVGPYVSFAGTGWVGLGLTLLYIVPLCFIPESPVFYVISENDDEARKTLRKLGRVDEIDNVLATKVDNKNNISEKWKEIFTIKSNRKALTITLTLGILQQMSGVVAIVFFVTTIFELAGSSVTPDIVVESFYVINNDSTIATIIIGVTQLVSSCITPFFVEWSGRKTIMLASTAACCISQMVLGIYFYLDDIGEPLESVGWVPLVTLIMFFVSYDLGFSIIPNTLIGEMFRSNVRSSGSALTMTTAWLFGFGVATAFGYMITFVGFHWTFWFFAAACGVAFLFTLAFVPETRGKSLVEIQDMLSLY